MTDLIISDAMKAVTGRLLPGLALGGILLSGTAAYGYAVAASPDAATGPADLGTVSGQVVRAWMMMFLFAALFGAIHVTREYSAGTIGRSVLVAGRTRFLAVKTTTSAAVGALFGLVAVTLGLASAQGFLPLVGAHPVWTRDVWLTAAGVFACCVAAGVWGAALGWIIRHQVGAVSVVVFLTLVVEPALQRIVPDVSAYLLTIAMSALYLDGKPELLSVPLALTVVVGWLAAAWLLARRQLLARDI
jgi:ABC-2 type transport system permease protein